MSDTEDSNMSDTQESSRDQKRTRDLKGEDIFGKYDDTESKRIPRRQNLIWRRMRTLINGNMSRKRSTSRVFGIESYDSVQ